MDIYKYTEVYTNTEIYGSRYCHICIYSDFSFVQIENLFAQVTSLWRSLRAGSALHMGAMCRGQYLNLAVFFTNLMTLFRGSQVASYFETEDLVFQVTVNEYMEMAGGCPV